MSFVKNLEYLEILFYVMRKELNLLDLTPFS